MKALRTTPQLVERIYPNIKEFDILQGLENNRYNEAGTQFSVDEEINTRILCLSDEENGDEIDPRLYTSTVFKPDESDMSNKGARLGEIAFYDMIIYNKPDKPEYDLMDKENFPKRLILACRTKHNDGSPNIKSTLLSAHCTQYDQWGTPIRSSKKWLPLMPFYKPAFAIYKAKRLKLYEEYLEREEVLKFQKEKGKKNKKEIEE